MNNQTEELLQAGMARFTADVTMPSGLAAKAARHRQRRKFAASAAATGTAAAAAVTAVAVAAATPSASPTVHAQTAAYVIGRTEAALGVASSQNVIQYVRETASGKSVFDITNLKAGTYAEWAYQGKARFVSYTADGQLSGDMAAQTTGTQYTTTKVSYQDKTWWRQTITMQSAMPAYEPRCGIASSVSGPALAFDWATQMRAALKCGMYTVAGTDQVDGVQALKLTPAARRAGAPGEPGGPVTVFWVDPSTYLPVRDVTTMGPDATMQVDFQWLRPARANPADLNVVIPARFSQVSPPKGFIPGH